MPSLLDTFAGEPIVPHKPAPGGDGGRLADTFLENRRSVVPIATDMLPNRHGPTKRCCRSATTIRGAGIQLSGGAWVRIVRAGMGDTNRVVRMIRLRCQSSRWFIPDGIAQGDPGSVHLCGAARILAVPSHSFFVATRGLACRCVVGHASRVLHVRRLRVVPGRRAAVRPASECCRGQARRQSGRPALRCAWGCPRSD